MRKTTFTSIFLWLVVLVLAVFLVLLILNGLKKNNLAWFKKDAVPETTAPALVFVPNNTAPEATPTPKPTATSTPTPSPTLPGGTVKPRATANPAVATPISGTIPKTGPGEVVAALSLFGGLAVTGLVRYRSARAQATQAARSIEVL